MPIKWRRGWGGGRFWDESETDQRRNDPGAMPGEGITCLLAGVGHPIYQHLVGFWAENGDEEVHGNSQCLSTEGANLVCKIKMCF